MPYATEQAAATRTPQAILTLAVPYCANFYGQTVLQYILGATQDFSNVTEWTKSGGTTVTTDTHQAPNGAVTADTLAFAAVGDNIKSLQSPLACASKAFTGSVWLRSTAGTGTVTLELRDNADAEGSLVQVSLTTAWFRFSLHKLFSGGATGGVFLRIKRDTGDLASVVAWGANLTRNPADADRVMLFPYTEGLVAAQCAAVDLGDGARCFYTFPTCQDRAHFNAGHDYEDTPALRGIREYKFCLKDAPLPFKGGSIVPALDSYDEAPQEIDPRRGITKAEKVSYRLSDDAGPGVWDIEKQSDGALVNTQRGAGTFWRRFLPIHKNYSNPRGYARLAVGYVASGMTEADYQTRLEGPVLSVSLETGGRIVVRATDALENLKRKVPTKISSTNKLAIAIDASATEIELPDITEIDEPPVDGAYKVTLQIDSEKMNVTARNLTTNRATVERGRWGTSAAAHFANAAVTALVEFGTEQTTPANPVLAKNPIDCAYEILRRSGILSAKIKTATLYDERDTWLSSAIDATNGTQTGVLFRRTITEPISLEDLLFKDSELCDSVLLWIWQDEDRTITGKVFAPIRPTETAVELTDGANLTADSISVEDDNEARLSRVIYGYDLDPAESGDELGHYLKQQARILSDEESPGFYGAQRDKIIKSKWLSGVDTGTAAAVAARILNRFRNGARLVTASVEVKDDADVKLGAFVRVSSAWLQTTAGATEQKRIMQVVKKEHLSHDTGRIRVTLADSGLFGRFGFWSSAADALPDYDAATALQQQFGFWADANGKVDDSFSDPYRWW